MAEQRQAGRGNSNVCLFKLFPFLREIDTYAHGFIPGESPHKGSCFLVKSTPALWWRHSAASEEAERQRTKTERAKRYFIAVAETRLSFSNGELGCSRENEGDRAASPNNLSVSLDEQCLSFHF